MHCLFFKKGFYQKLIAFFLCAAVLLTSSPCSAAQKKKAKARSKRPQPSNVAVPTQICPEDTPFYSEIQPYLGIPYLRGGANDGGMDCSGFAMRFYSKAFGIELPHSSFEQSRLDFLDKVTLNEDEFQASDLLFFANRKKRINHVGIYLADGKFIHAVPKAGITISSLDESYWRRRLVASRRLKSELLPGEMQRVGEHMISSWDDLFDRPGSAEQMLALGYSQTLADKSLLFNVGAFHSTYFDQVPARETPAPVTSLVPEPEAVLNTTYRLQGLKAFVDYTPSRWLRITPSLTMIDNSRATAVWDAYQHIYGLETSVLGTQADWYLAFSAHSVHPSYLYPWRLQDVDSQRRLDLALSFGYRLSDALSFAVSGTRETDEDMGLDMVGSDKSMGGFRDLTIRFDWNF